MVSMKVRHDGRRVRGSLEGGGGAKAAAAQRFYLLDDFQASRRTRTLISDLRNRGRSDLVSDGAKLTRGILQDVDDLDVVRRHFGFDRVDLIAHSYAGKTAILYAMKYTAHAGRIVQLGPVPPDQAAQYPPPLSNVDATLLEFFAKASELQKERATTEPKELCRKFWSLLRPIYVVNPADAGKIAWERCDLPTELGFMKYWLEHLVPSGCERGDTECEDRAGSPRSGSCTDERPSCRMAAGRLGADAAERCPVSRRHGSRAVIESPE